MRIIGIAATIGAGKNTACSYIMKKYGYQMIVMGDLVREAARELGLKPNRENLQKVQKIYTDKHGLDYWARETIKKIRKEGWEKVLINGIRRPEDAKVPKEEFGKDFVLILIDATPEIRFARLKKRARIGDPKTWEEFERQEMNEWKLFRFKRMLSYVDYRVENNGTLEELYERIDELIRRIGFA
jgi:dephospho-CoA kinase